MNKINIFHIHTDIKFLHNSKKFHGEGFLNTDILIKGNASLSLKNNKNLIIFDSEKEDLDEIVNHCKNAQIIVLYDLDSVKSRIALALPKNIIVFWRFFGYELYGKRRDLFLSELSNKIDVHKPSILDLVKNILRPTYNLLTSRKNSDEIFNTAVKRIDYIIGLCDEEYELLISLWPELPQFIKLPHAMTAGVDKIFNIALKEAQEAPIIIIGNNRSSYNNHFDLIGLIEKYKSKTNYSFQLLFNYGLQNIYTNTLINEIGNKKYFLIHDKFMDKDMFTRFYECATALVIDGYRQMAVGNIYLAFQKGLKVYLNDKNIFKKFLENQGFKIFSIEDFENDLKNNNLSFDNDNAQFNFDNFKQFSNRYTIHDFQKNILSIFEGN